MDTFDSIRAAITDHESNASMRAAGWHPLYVASARARIAVIGQAPGRKAQASGVAWNDASGTNLVNWLGVRDEQFRDAALFAQLPMDFYFPGTGTSGDLPPRKGFAAQWHPPLLALMPNIRLTLLIGRYAQLYYLPQARRDSLTTTVHNYASFLPRQFPLVHPSPLNFRWQAQNPWFATEVLPHLKTLVQAALTPDD